MLGTELESFSNKDGDRRERTSLLRINSRVFQTVPRIFVNNNNSNNNIFYLKTVGFKANIAYGAV